MDDKMILIQYTIEKYKKEEEEMNQRRHLLTLARKGDQKAVSKLMELYQVKVYSGNSLKSLKIRKLPTPPSKPKKKKLLFHLTYR